VTNLLKFKVRRQEEIAAIEQQDMQKHRPARSRHGAPWRGRRGGAGRIGSAHRRSPASHSSPPRAAPKIGRNDLCPCGSGKKFKKCHGTSDGSGDESEDATARRGFCRRVSGSRDGG
jgi:preprotein translocase subunit SecA